jgi:hypothetical protein
MRQLLILSALLLSGCISEYSGSTTTVGEEIAWPEIANGSDTVKVRVFQSIKGARVWTAKDSNVSIEYQNSYTNTYFGMVSLSDYMKLKVDIGPITNSLDRANLK